MATFEWGLSADCGLSYQPLRSQSPRKKRKKERKGKIEQISALYKISGHFLRE